MFFIGLFLHISAFAVCQSDKNCSVIRLGGVSGGPSGGCGLVRTEQDLRLSVSCAPSTVEQVHSCERLTPQRDKFSGAESDMRLASGVLPEGGLGQKVERASKASA